MASPFKVRCTGRAWPTDATTTTFESGVEDFAGVLYVVNRLFLDVSRGVNHHVNDSAVYVLTRVGRII